MENGKGFGQQPSFEGKQLPRPVGDIIVKPNGRIVYPGESFRTSAPVPGTSNRKHRSQGQIRGR